MLIAESETRSAVDAWERHTLKADELFHQKNFQAALNEFEAAAHCLEVRLSGPQVASATAIRCWVIGCQNAAFCAMKLNKKSIAERYYRLCLKTLQQLSAMARYHRQQDLLEIELGNARMRYEHFLRQTGRSSDGNVSKPDVTYRQDKPAWLPSLFTGSNRRLSRLKLLFY